MTAIASAPPAATAGTLAVKRFPWVSGGIMAVFVLCGVLGPGIAPHDPDRLDLSKSLLPPVFAGGQWAYPLGTDQLGRDILSRLLAGAQVSFLVGAGAVVLAGAIGLVVALVAGYAGGRLDTVLTRIADSSMAFPVVLLAIVLVAIYGQSIAMVVLVLVLAVWPQYARVLRSEVLRAKGQDFVTMSAVMGAGRRWIVTRHVLPNLVPTLLVLATLQLGFAIIAEGSLSFLGIGVPPPAASWGSMLADGRSYLSTAWWLPLLPGLALSITVLAANLLGDRLRELFDPATRR
ncbi:ABC transporter permease [Amycolatopsis acidicola]|uniref:ABC transporter permease n=1 Tax=Amycolatopsis acidicola TaxID=2596893 RepID=A0A5N0URY3_9PSEU|nr:ABC transporter permease [Amycolatopsis acidicola]KAA9151860.1 ABC transporter permease [Amycolatopsis acidicola]